MNIEPRSFLAAEEAGAPADAPADASPLSPAGALAAHIEAADFPCVGAKSALAQDGLQVETARDITRGADDARIHRALARWSMLPADAAPEFRSLAVVFAGPPDLDERDFEAALWARLGSLAALDRAAGFAPEPGFSSDPADAHFALSFGGKAYFAVGLHPNASRRARRLPSPGNRLQPPRTVRKAARRGPLRADARGDPRPRRRL